MILIKELCHYTPKISRAASAPFLEITRGLARPSWKASGLWEEVINMSVRFLTAFLKSSGENGIVMLESGGEQKTVLVDRKALMALGSPPRADETRLQENVRLLCDIAEAKLSNSVALGQSIRISEADVTNWKRHH
ncbi:hypothetical protein [Rhizobium mesoamericanum]|uniref:hypothetical protein n=1 Tax=Rhizobium mesoamericanum TaxID=1079800 RepID=UPI001F2EE1E0|nr:hypothetical protein [Rhizobium mesoamericanum]